MTEPQPMYKVFYVAPLDGQRRLMLAGCYEIEEATRVAARLRERGQSNVFMRRVGSGRRSVDAAIVKSVVLTAFRRLLSMGLQATASAGSAGYLPRLILQHGLAEGFTRAELARAMRQLVSDGVLCRQQISRYPNRTPRFGLRLAAELTEGP